jgi:hypothetical protein
MKCRGQGLLFSYASLQSATELLKRRSGTEKETGIHIPMPTQGC